MLDRLLAIALRVAAREGFLEEAEDPTEDDR
jgi:hypothetical protein